MLLKKTSLSLGLKISSEEDDSRIYETLGLLLESSVFPDDILTLNNDHESCTL